MDGAKIWDSHESGMHIKGAHDRTQRHPNSDQYEYSSNRPSKKPRYEDDSAAARADRAVDARLYREGLEASNHRSLGPAYGHRDSNQTSSSLSISENRSRHSSQHDSRSRTWPSPPPSAGGTTISWRNDDQAERESREQPFTASRSMNPEEEASWTEKRPVREDYDAENPKGRSSFNLDSNRTKIGPFSIPF